MYGHVTSPLRHVIVHRYWLEMYLRAMNTNGVRVYQGHMRPANRSRRRCACQRLLGPSLREARSLISYRATPAKSSAACPAVRERKRMTWV